MLLEHFWLPINWKRRAGVDLSRKRKKEELKTRYHI
jgi:hypothetical protein